MTQPLVSLIMSTCNDVATVRDTITSVLQQTYTHFECLIIDDGSVDGTIDVLRDFAKQDRRVVLYDSKETHGLTYSLNILLSRARGEYVARIDADDVAVPDRLNKQVIYLSTHPNVVLCGSQGWYMNELGECMGKKVLPCEYKDIKRRLPWNNQLIHSSWMFRRNTVVQLGGYDLSFKKSQDYELLLRIAKKYAVVNLPECLIYWRVRPQSISWKNRQQEWYALKARWYAIVKYGYPFWYSLGCFVFRLVWICVPLWVKRRRYAH